MLFANHLATGYFVTKKTESQPLKPHSSTMRYNCIDLPTELHTPCRAEIEEFSISTKFPIFPPVTQMPINSYFSRFFDNFSKIAILNKIQIIFQFLNFTSFPRSFLKL